MRADRLADLPSAVVRRAGGGDGGVFGSLVYMTVWDFLRRRAEEFIANRGVRKSKSLGRRLKNGREISLGGGVVLLLGCDG